MSFGLPAGNTAGGDKPALGFLNTNTGAPKTGGLFGNTAPSTGGGLFGAPAPATAATNATPAAGGLFGGGSGLFGNAATSNTSSGPADTSAPKPASNFFSNPPAASGSTTTTSTSAFPSGGLFGAKPAATNSLANAAPLGGTPATNPLSSFTLGGNKDAPAPTLGGGLFGKPAEKKDDAPAAPSLGGLFGKPAEKKDDAPAAPSLGGGLFGKPAEKKDGTPAPAAPAAGGFSLFGGKKDDKPAEATSALATKPAEGSATAVAPGTATKALSNTLVSVPPPSMLRGKTIEEIVNRWTADLETYSKEFSKFAGEVAVWDRVLVENGNNLSALCNHATAAERQQIEIDQTLDNIEQQQQDLLASLDQYEKAAGEIIGAQGGLGSARLDAGPADTERDRNYMLASDLHNSLDDLSASLTQMIDNVNTLSLAQKPANERNDDPMAQISQVLSSHLESLQWIDTAVRDVGGKVNEVEKRVKESGQAYGNGSRQRGFNR